MEIMEWHWPWYPRNSVQKLSTRNISTCICVLIEHKSWTVSLFLPHSTHFLLLCDVSPGTFVSGVPSVWCMKPTSSFPSTLHCITWLLSTGACWPCSSLCLQAQTCVTLDQTFCRAPGVQAHCWKNLQPDERAFWHWSCGTTYTVSKCSSFLSIRGQKNTIKKSLTDFQRLNTAFQHLNRLSFFGYV